MTNVPDEIAMVFAAAQTQQQVAEAAIEQLKRHTQQLEPLVRETIRRALLEGVHALRVETDRALTGLQELHRGALPRAFWLTLGSAAFGLVATLILGVCFIPSREEIAQRQATLAALMASGAQAQLSRCATPHGAPKLCIRVDPAAGPFGVARDYYLVHQDSP
jgi:hypothetical protein